MGTGTNPVKPLSPGEITRREKRAKQLLRQKFKTTKQLQKWRGHMDIGLTRLTEKGAMARTMSRHMKRRGITTVAELADKLYLNPKCEELSWVCVPNAFRHTRSAGRDLKYLLVLCDLEWDKDTRTYIPISAKCPA